MCVWCVFVREREGERELCEGGVGVEKLERDRALACISNEHSTDLLPLSPLFIKKTNFRLKFLLFSINL